MSFAGMDVGVVYQVSAGLGVQAGNVASITSTVEGLVSQSLQLWEGADAVDFAHLWHSSHRPMLESLRQVLDEMAVTARVNAEEQDVASSDAAGGRSPGGAGDPGSASGGSPGRGSGVDLGGLSAAFAWSGMLAAAAETFLGPPGWLSKALDVRGHLKGAPAAFSVLGKFLKVEAVLESGYGVYDGISRGEVDVALLGGVDMVGALAPAPIGLGIGVLDLFAKTTIPVGGDAQQSLLDYQATRMFGHPSTELTADQSQRLMEHYSGGWGFALMISDKMDQSWDDGPGAWLGW